MPAQMEDKLLPSETAAEMFITAMAGMSAVYAIQRAALAFDGRNLAVPVKQLPFQERTVDIDLSSTGQARRFRLKITIANRVEPEVLDDFEG
jgi:hypothetical protein